MENNKFTLGDMKQVIENMGEEKSVRLHGYHNSDITLEVYKQDNRPEALMNLVSVRFEMNGRVIARANYIRVEELEKALNEIKDGKTNYFFGENPATLDERIAREKDFQFYIQELGRLEDKQPMFDVERCTECYGYGVYTVKPAITDKYLIERYNELSWENNIDNMMKVDEDFVRLFGQKSAKNIALLAKANSIAFSVYEGLTNCWVIEGAVKLNIFEERSEDYGSAKILETRADFQICETLSSGNNGLAWFTDQIKQIANTPQKYITNCEDNDAVIIAAAKLKDFAEELETYAAELKKARGSIERD